MEKGISNSYQEYLDSCLKNYYSEVVEKFNFRTIRENVSGIGALHEFQNDFFRLKITNDRGIVSSEIASLHGTGSYIEISILNSYLRLSKIEGQISKWDIKFIIKGTLSCEEAVKVIDLNYDTIVSLLNKNNYEQTCTALDKLMQL